MSQSDRAKSLLREMESYFGAAKEDEGAAGGSGVNIMRDSSFPIKPDSAKAPQPQHPGERRPYELVKRMEDGNRDEWLLDWVSEYGDICFFCQKIVDFANFEVHHKDKAHIPLNGRENTALSHPGCNRSNREFESSAPQATRERDSPVRKRYTLGILDGRIGNPTSKQRALFDEWKMGLATVPNMDDWPFPLLVGVGSTPMRLDKEVARRIARIAPYACGLGSSKTYMEYIMEDAEAGIFVLSEKGREYSIAYAEDVAHMVAYNLAKRSDKSDISTSVQEGIKA